VKAQVLTISIPNYGCDKSCPFCVSKMTGCIPPDTAMMKRNVPKVKTVARAARVGSVLLTGKGEPCRNMASVREFVFSFRDFPVELQTNGRVLDADPDMLAVLSDLGLDVLAVSVNSLGELQGFRGLFGRVRKLGLTSRATVNLTPEAMTDSFVDYVHYAGLCSVDQLSFRTITVPSGTDPADPRAVWIRENVVLDTVRNWMAGMSFELKAQGRVVRRLPYGAVLYDYRGLSVTHFDYCIQDSHGEDDVRSLIFQEDGHLYTTWNSRASRLF